MYYVTSTLQDGFFDECEKYHTGKKIIISTFDYFWAEFHRVNPQRKTDKMRCENLWNNCNFSDRKKAAITDITKTNLSSFEYLKCFKKI